MKPASLPQSLRKMRYFLLLFSVIMISCASRPAVTSSPPTNVSISYIPNDTNGRPFYRISTTDGSELGRIKSIIDAETVKNVPGLPVDQKLIWSPSGKTALIYENMSDASPDYQHVLIRLNPESQSFQAYKIDLGTRYSSREDIYGHWPTVIQISDSVIDLDWATEPKHEKVEIPKLISGTELISEQAGSSNGG